MKLITVAREGHGDGVNVYHYTTISVLGREVLTITRSPGDVNVELSVGLVQFDVFLQRPVGNHLVSVEVTGGLVLRGTENHKLVPVPYLTVNIDSAFGALTVGVL